MQELKENAERVQEYFKQLLCSRLSYGAMNATLQQEAVNLETRTDWHAPMNMRRGTLQSVCIAMHAARFCQRCTASGGAALRSYEGCMQKCEGLRKHTDGDPERAAAIPGER